jgi:hypothetical protein
MWNDQQPEPAESQPIAFFRQEPLLKGNQKDSPLKQEGKDRDLGTLAELVAKHGQSGIFFFAVRDFP